MDASTDLVGLSGSPRAVTSCLWRLTKNTDSWRRCQFPERR